MWLKQFTVNYLKLSAYIEHVNCQFFNYRLRTVVLSLGFIGILLWNLFTRSNYAQFFLHNSFDSDAQRDCLANKKVLRTTRHDPPHKVICHLTKVNFFLTTKPFILVYAYFVSCFVILLTLVNSQHTSSLFRSVSWSVLPDQLTDAFLHCVANFSPHVSCQSFQILHQLWLYWLDFFQKRCTNDLLKSSHASRHMYLSGPVSDFCWIFSPLFLRTQIKVCKM